MVIAPNQEAANKIRKTDAYFLKKHGPKNFTAGDPENVLVKSQKDFDKICVHLESKGMREPQKASVSKFFAMVDFFETDKSKDNGISKTTKGLPRKGV